MGPSRPSDLAALFDGHEPAAQHAAWAGFLRRYHRLLLKVAGAFGGDYDDRMDRYRFMVEALAANDYRRLRQYQSRRHSSFAAWLTVVARRLCVDHDRSLVGRADRTARASREARRVRHGLLDLTGLDGDYEAIADDAPDPAGRLEREERRAAVERALTALPARDRLLIRLRFDDDLSVREIAKLMAFPSVFHVYRRLRLVLGALERELSPHKPSVGRKGKNP